MSREGKAARARVMLVVIGVVGTTVAPWQLFFQQSYLIDKRITPRFIKYERLDLWLRIALVIVGAVAVIAFTAATFGPWVNAPWLNYFTGAVIAVLVLLSIVLTASVLFPGAEQVILGIKGGGGVGAIVVALVIMALSQNGKAERAAAPTYKAMVSRATWRMPPLDQLPRAKLSLAAKTWMGVLRLYLVVAGGLVLFHIVMLALGNGCKGSSQ